MKKEYERLPNRAAQEFEMFSLAWQDALKFDDSAKHIENELLSYRIKT